MELKRMETKPSTQATWLLVIACIVAFPFGLQHMEWACSYNNIFLAGRWWTVFSALFMHGSLGHLAGNMLFLFLFGRGLEKEIGSGGLLLVFIAGGAISMLLSIFYYPHSLPSVGASGAISAILATLMLFNPWKLSLLLNFFPMPLGVAGFTFLLVNFGSFITANTAPQAGNMHVAYLAHIIGFVAGIVIGSFLTPDWKKNLLYSILQFIGFYLLLWGAVGLFWK